MCRWDGQHCPPSQHDPTLFIYLAANVRQWTRLFNVLTQPIYTAPGCLPSGAIGAALFRTISDVARAKESRRVQPAEPTTGWRPRSIHVRMGALSIGVLLVVEILMGHCHRSPHRQLVSTEHI